MKSYNDERPSRTQRAINAKHTKNEKHTVSEHEDEGEQTSNKSNLEKQRSKETFTSDGIEALKPFEI